MIQHLAHHTNLYSDWRIYMGIFSFPLLKDVRHHESRFHAVADISQGSGSTCYVVCVFGYNHAERA